MSTRSSIAMRDGNSIKAIYCHFDGYLEGVGEMLTHHYNSPERAEALLAMGNLSSLEASLERPEGHSFNNQIKGYTLAYGRDRGDLDYKARSYNSIKDWIEADGQEFNYLWDHGWWVSEDLCPTRFSRLSRWEDPDESEVIGYADLFDSKDYDEELTRPKTSPEAHGVSLEQALEELRKLRTEQLCSKLDGTIHSRWGYSEDGLTLSLHGRCLKVHEDLKEIHPNGWYFCDSSTLEEVLAALNLDLVCSLKPKS